MIGRTFLCLSLVAACMADEPDLAEVEQLARCPFGICGGNSPIIKIYNAVNFNLDGVPNQDGLVVMGIYSDANRFMYAAEVRDSRLYAVNPQNGDVLKDHDLVGLRIMLNTPIGEQFGIVIQSIGAVPEAVDPGWSLQTYWLDWEGVSPGTEIPSWIVPGQYVETPPPVFLPPVHVCPNPPPWHGDPYTPGQNEWDEGRAMWTSTTTTPYHSLLFEGDIFDVEKRTVSQVPEPRWFNIGCATHTLAKLRLTRNTWGTTNDWKRVQAALKNLTADYCGGTPDQHTVPGEPLIWRDRGTMTYWGTPIALEARWSERGAICLDEPRFAKRHEVQLGCKRQIPYCDPKPGPYDWVYPRAGAFRDPTELVTSALPNY